MKSRSPGIPIALVPALAVAITVLISGCGGKVIDQVKAEEFIRQDLAGVGVEVESVTCPSGIEVAAGTDFECDVAADGERAVVQMRIVDDEGLVRPIEIRAVKGGQQPSDAETG